MFHVGGREILPGASWPLGTAAYKAEPKSLPARQEVRGAHSVCLAACVSGGLKSRSARGHGSISKSGGNASLAEGGGRYGEVYTGTKAKAGDSQDGPTAASCNLSEGRASTARWSLKGLRSTTGSYSTGAIPPRNRSAQAGEGSSLHYGGEGAVVPPQRTTVCAGDTVGKRHT